MGLIYNKDEEKWYLEDGTVLGGDEEDENGYDRVSEYQTLVDMGVIQDNIGQYGKGNIDLYNRPQVKNNDGTTSTVRSMAFEEDGQHILVPTVGDNGNIMSDEEAIEAYHNSGNYLGKFTTADEADEYAQALHTQQETFMNFDEPASFTDADYEKDTNKFGQPYQKLTVGETLQDMGAALGTEILDILRPKKGGAADKLLPDWIPREIEYAAKTHAAENTAFLYRGISGLLGFAAPMGWAKGAIYAPKAVKGLKGLQALLQSNKSQGVLAKVGMALFTPVEAQSKLGKFLAAAPELIGATLASEFVLSRPEEKEQTIGDMYPDAPFADSLKTDSNDSLLTAKAKLALGNSAIGIASGPFLSLVLNPLIKGGVKAWAKYIKNPDDTAAKAAVDAVKAQSQNVAKETDIINNLSSIKEQAKAAVDEERYIKDYAREKGYDPDSAWEIYKHLDEGKSIIPNADGSYSIHVEKWQDAADVSLEELKAQTGNDGVELMNETVKDTWRERGLLTDPEGDLFNHNSQQEIVPGNKNTKNIVNYYKDKWDLDNSKIEVQYGDWEAIPNGRTSVQDGKVIIQINKNTQNPYAVLRSELEHTRDTVKGEVPNQGERHFSRYEGKNESEMSLSYVKKKADTRAGKEPLQTHLNNLKLNKENTNEQGTDNTTNKTNQLSGGTSGLDGESSRSISRYNNQGNDGTGLFVRRDGLWVINNNSKNPFNNNKISKISYRELPQNVESGNSFYNAISQAKADLGDLGTSVHTYTPEEYSQMRCFISEDGMSGIAVKLDGDIVSVFVNPKAKAADIISKGSGRGHALVELAKQNGGTKLDAFDTYLPDFYKKHGFEETGRDIWNEQYKPEGWNKDFYKQYNKGEPDVVYMEYKTEPKTLTEADTRGYTYLTGQETINGMPTGVKQLKNKAGKVLAEVRYIDSRNSYRIRMDNYGIQKGAARKALAELMKEYPDKNFYWEAINEQSIKSYQHFIKEYPELAKRIRFENTVEAYNNLAEFHHNLYNYDKAKGDVNETQLSGSEREGSSEALRNNNSSSNTGLEEVSGEQSGDIRQPGDIQVQSDSSSNSLLGKGNTENSYNNNQLRQDYNQQGTSRPVEQGATSVEKQLSSAETMGDVDKIVENQLANDVETSSMKWEDIANDADDLYRKIGQLAGDDNNLLALKQAFAADDVQTADMLVRKVMAATRVFGDLTQQAKEILREKGDPTEIYKALTYISQYIKDTASGFGGGLNAMKFKNKSLNFFSITTLEQQGMEHLAELLHKDFQGLNFTRPVEENLQELYKKISGYLEGKFWNNIMADADFAKALDNHLRRALANGDASEEALLNMVQGLARETVYRETENFLKKAVDLPSRLRWFQKGMDIAQASPTLYVSSILTSPLTHFRNGVSGAFMTLYKPLSKILGGAMALDTSMIKEGVYTYHYLFGTSQTMKEALKIGLHTLKTGEGTLTGMGHTATDMTTRIETMFKFNELGNPNASIGQKLMDFLTFSSRLMGAEDEFITQLNYRAMSRAKALATAERQANALGLKGETRAKFLEERTDSLFQAAFDSRGRAVDTDLYASSREATFQGDLSGKYYDPFEGNKVQKKEATVTMRVGAAAQDLIRKVPFLKYFQPFVRTPANIAQFGLEHNAIYAFCSPSQRRILFSKTREGAEARGKLAVGLLTFWGGLNLASQGLITGSAPPDTKTRERLLKTGWQPYSIHVGNKYISYKGLDPVESWLSFAADSFIAWNAFDPDSYQGSHMANWLYKQAQLMVTHALESTGFINSVSELNELFEMTEANDTEKVEKLLANKLRGMTPYSSLGNYIGYVNPLNPDKDAQRRPQGLKETYVNKFFLADGMGDYRRNYFGERLDLYYTMGLFPTSEEKTEIEDEEIQRLTEEGWQPSELSENYTTYGINFRDYKEQGETTSLHDLMLETLSKITLEGKTLREAARELIQSEEYQELLDGIKIEEKGTNDTKINKLKALFKRYKDAAKEEVIKKYGDDYVNKEGISPKARVADIRTEQEARLREARLDDTIKELDDYWNN